MKVFISHSSKDKEFVQRLAKDLRTRASIDAWLDQWEITPGDKIPTTIEKALAEAEVLIFILSPDSLNSPWAEYERQAWLTMQIQEEKQAKQAARPFMRRLIPILYRDCQKPAFLQPIHHIAMNDQDYEDGFKSLVSAIREEATKPPLEEETPTLTAPIIGTPPRLQAMTLLKRLLPVQFDEVVFIRHIPSAYLPTNVAQVQKALAVIEYAVQQEGEEIPKLLDAIFTVAPHLKGRN
jgi:hypothetical protein